MIMHYDNIYIKLQTYKICIICVCVCACINITIVVKRVHEKKINVKFTLVLTSREI